MSIYKEFSLKQQMRATHKISTRVSRGKKNSICLRERGKGKSKSKCQKRDINELQYAENDLSYFYVTSIHIIKALYIKFTYKERQSKLSQSTNRGRPVSIVSFYFTK
jgi:hypothetical protein